MNGSVDVEVDMNRVVEVLKSRYAAKVADLEAENSMLHVALEKAIGERDEALNDNRQLRERLGSSPQ